MADNHYLCLRLQQQIDGGYTASDFSIISDNPGVLALAAKAFPNRLQGDVEVNSQENVLVSEEFGGEIIDTCAARPVSYCLGHSGNSRD